MPRDKFADAFDAFEEYARTYPPPQAAFRYRDNGNTQIAVHADPPSEAEAKPFHVVMQSRGWIPISVLVFARDETHAAHRVLTTIRECIEKDHDSSRGERAQRLLDDLASGKLHIFAKAYDYRQISAKVIWASNGGVL